MNPTPSTAPLSSSGPSTPSAPASQPATDLELDGEVIRAGDFQKQYERFSPLVMSMAEDDLEFFRGDKTVVLRNVRTGLRSVVPELDRIRAMLPMTPVAELMELNDLAKALFYAVGLVSDPVSAREIEERSRRVSTGRKELLATAELLARRGLLPADRVAAIRAGRGRLDVAADAIALAGLYTEFQAAIAGKHAFTRAEIEQLAEDGEWLAQALNPRGLRKETVPSTVTPRMVRDRLYALIVQRHTELRRVGSYLWGDQVDRYVPKLSSRLLGGRPAAGGAGDPAAEVSPAAGAPANA